MSGAQNNKIVVKPQNPYSTFSAANDGIDAISKPPIEVASNAKAISLRAENRSASGPLGKYANIATTPYTEKAIPSSVLVSWNTSNSVGRNMRGSTNGRKKTASPATMSDSIATDRRISDGSRSRFCTHVVPVKDEELSLRYHEAPIRSCQSRRRAEPAVLLSPEGSANCWWPAVTRSRLPKRPFARTSLVPWVLTESWKD